MKKSLKQSGTRALSLLIIVSICFAILPFSAIAETMDEPALVQTLTALIYTDDTYAKQSDDDTLITVKGSLPDGTAVKAYPVELDIEGICAAYDISLFNKKGDTFEPDEPVSVTISSEAISAAAEQNGAPLEVIHIDDNSNQTTVEEVSQTENGVTFEADSFSIYGVVSPYRNNYALLVSEQKVDSSEDNEANADWHTVYVYPRDTQREAQLFFRSADVNDENNDYGGTPLQSVEWSLDSNVGNKSGSFELKYYDSDKTTERTTPLPYMGESRLYGSSTTPEQKMYGSFATLWVDRAGDVKITVKYQYEGDDTYHYQYFWLHLKLVNSASVTITGEDGRLGNAITNAKNGTSVPNSGSSSGISKAGTVRLESLPPMLLKGDVAGAYDLSDGEYIEDETTLTEEVINSEKAGIANGTPVKLKYTWYKSDTRNGAYVVVKNNHANLDKDRNILDGGTAVNAFNDDGGAKFYKLKVSCTHPVLGLISFTSAEYQVPYDVRIHNGNFEAPIQPSTEAFPNGTEGLYWKTTGTGSQDQLKGEGLDVEIVNGDKVDKGDSSGLLGINNNNNRTYYVDPLPKSGITKNNKQCAEINAENAGTIYQTVLTQPGDEMYWEFWHASRGEYVQPYRQRGTSMYMICIDDDSGSKILTNADVDAVANAICTESPTIKQGEYSTNYSYTYYNSEQNQNVNYTCTHSDMYIIEHWQPKSNVNVTLSTGNITIANAEIWRFTDNISDNNKTRRQATQYVDELNGYWHPYNGSYTVPEGQHVTRFLFAAAPDKDDNSDRTYGNFIDEIAFTSKHTSYRIEYYKYNGTAYEYVAHTSGQKDVGSYLTADNIPAAVQGLTHVTTTYGPGQDNLNSSDLPVNNDTLDGLYVHPGDNRIKDDTAVGMEIKEEYSGNNKINVLRLYYADSSTLSSNINYKIQYYKFNTETLTWDAVPTPITTGTETQGQTIDAEDYSSQFPAGHTLFYSTVGTDADDTLGTKPRTNFNAGSTNTEPDVKPGEDRYDNGHSTEMVLTSQYETNVLNLYFVDTTEIQYDIKYFIWDAETNQFVENTALRNLDHENRTFVKSPYLDEKITAVDISETDPNYKGYKVIGITIGGPAEEGNPKADKNDFTDPHEYGARVVADNPERETKNLDDFTFDVDYKYDTYELRLYYVDMNTYNYDTKYYFYNYETGEYELQYYTNADVIAHLQANTELIAELPDELRQKVHDDIVSGKGIEWSNLVRVSLIDSKAFEMGPFDDKDLPKMVYGIDLPSLESLADLHRDTSDPYNIYTLSYNMLDEVSQEYTYKSTTIGKNDVSDSFEGQEVTPAAGYRSATEATNIQYNSDTQINIYPMFIYEFTPYKDYEERFYYIPNTAPEYNYKVEYYYYDETNGYVRDNSKTSNLTPSNGAISVTNDQINNNLTVGDKVYKVKAVTGGNGYEEYKDTTTGTSDVTPYSGKRSLITEANDAYSMTTSEDYTNNTIRVYLVPDNFVPYNVEYYIYDSENECWSEPVTSVNGQSITPESGYYLTQNLPQTFTLGTETTSKFTGYTLFKATTGDSSISDDTSNKAVKTGEGRDYITSENNITMQISADDTEKQTLRLYYIPNDVKTYNYAFEYYEFDEQRNTYVKKQTSETGSTTTTGDTVSVPSYTPDSGYSLSYVTVGGSETDDTFSGSTVTTSNVVTDNFPSDMTISGKYDTQVMRLYYTPESTPKYRIEYYVNENGEYVLKETEGGSAAANSQITASSDLVSKYSSMGTLSYATAGDDVSDTINGTSVTAGTDRTTASTTTPSMTVSADNDTNVLRLYYTPAQNYTVEYWVYRNGAWEKDTANTENGTISSQNDTITANNTDQYPSSDYTPIAVTFGGSTNDDLHTAAGTDACRVIPGDDRYKLGLTHTTDVPVDSKFDTNVMRLYYVENTEDLVVVTNKIVGLDPRTVNYNQSNDVDGAVYNSTVLEGLIFATSDSTGFGNATAKEYVYLTARDYDEDGKSTVVFNRDESMPKNYVIESCYRINGLDPSISGTYVDMDGATKQLDNDYYNTNVPSQLSSYLHNDHTYGIRNNKVRNSNNNTATAIEFVNTYNTNNASANLTINKSFAGELVDSSSNIDLTVSYGSTTQNVTLTKGENWTKTIQVPAYSTVTVTENGAADCTTTMTVSGNTFADGTASASGKTADVLIGNTAVTVNITNTHSLPAPSGQGLTIKHDLYKNADRSDANSPTLLNGTGAASIQKVVLIDGSGNEIDLTNSGLVSYNNSEHTATVDKALLDAVKGSGYTLTAYLYADPADNNSYVETYRQNGTGYDTVISSIGENNILTYSVSVDSLYESNTENLAATEIDLYTQFRTSAFTLTFKYYDRDDVTGKFAVADISPNAKSISYNANFTIEENADYAQQITAFIASRIAEMGELGNSMDRIIFYPTQNAAVTALLSDSFLRKYTAADDLTYHTDRYGRAQGSENCEVNDGQKWISYLDENGNLIDDISGDNIYRVSEVVVWGFNTPKEYKASFVLPTTINDLTASNGNSVYFADGEKTASVEFASYYYNQRIGGKFNESSADGRDSASNHLEMYGLTFESTPGDGIANANGYLNIDQKVFTDTENNVSYKFDGWYIIDDKGCYVKVSDYEEIGCRITNDLVLYAGYKLVSENTGSSEISKGITLIKDNTEAYVNEAGETNYRYVTTMNTYGYDEPYNGFNNSQLALVYVVMDDISEIETTDLNKEILEKQFNQNVKNETRLEAKFDQMNNANNKTYSSTVRVGDVYKSIKYGTSKTNSIVYLYDLKTTDPTSSSSPTASSNNTITLTNRNRVQFVFDVEKGGDYSKVLVFVAVKDNDEWVFSDNFIVYDGINI